MTANVGYMNQMGTASKAPSSGGGFSGRDWADIIGGAAGGASKAFQSMGETRGSKKIAMEKKRRLLAKLLSGSMNKEFKLNNAQEENRESNREYQAEQLQDIARGFVDSLKGSTRRG